MTTTIPLHIILNEDDYSNYLANIEQNQGKKIDTVTLTRNSNEITITICFYTEEKKETK